MKKITYILILFTCFAAYSQAQNCPPIAICNSGLSVDLEPGGVLTMYPEDIREGTIPDSCLPLLTFELEIIDRNQNVIHPRAASIDLDCDDVGLDLLALLHVTKGMETNSCWGELTVRDDGGYCETFGNDTIPVRFNIFNRWRIPANSLNVKLNGNPVLEYKDGLFILERDDIQSGINTLEWDELNAQSFGEFSTLDVILGLRMFFDLNYLDIRALAMDADVSFSMSTNDLIYMREYILGQRSELSERTFVTLPNDYTFSNGFDRYDFGFDPYVWSFDGDTVDQVNFSYDVFSIGDLDNIDSLASGGTEPRNADPGVISYQDQWLEVGQSYEIPFNLSMTSGVGIYGFQIGINLDNWINFDVDHSYSSSSWMDNIHENEYRVSFAQLDAEDDIRFYITLTPKKSGYLSELFETSKEFHDEIVPEDIKGHRIEIRSKTVTYGKFNVLPNPVGDEINVVSPVPGPSTVKLYDLSGKILKTWNIEGYHTLLPASEINPGIYMLQIQNELNTTSFKLIKQ